MKKSQDRERSGVVLRAPGPLVHPRQAQPRARRTVQRADPQARSEAPDRAGWSSLEEYKSPREATSLARDALEARARRLAVGAIAWPLYVVARGDLYEFYLSERRRGAEGVRGGARDRAETLDALGVLEAHVPRPEKYRELEEMGAREAGEDRDVEQRRSGAGAPAARAPEQKASSCATTSPRRR